MVQMDSLNFSDNFSYIIYFIWSSGGSGLVRVIAGGEELTAPVERAASVRERARGGGEMEEELT